MLGSFVISSRICIAVLILSSQVSPLLFRFALDSSAAARMFFGTVLSLIISSNSRTTGSNSVSSICITLFHQFPQFCLEFLQLACNLLLSLFQGAHPDFNCFLGLPQFPLQLLNRLD